MKNKQPTYEAKIVVASAIFMKMYEIQCEKDGLNSVPLEIVKLRNSIRRASKLFQSSFDDIGDEITNVFNEIVMHLKEEKDKKAKFDIKVELSDDNDIVLHPLALCIGMVLEHYNLPKRHYILDHKSADKIGVDLMRTNDERDKKYIMFGFKVAGMVADRLK